MVEIRKRFPVMLDQDLCSIGYLLDVLLQGECRVQDIAFFLKQSKNFSLQHTWETKIHHVDILSRFFISQRINKACEGYEDLVRVTGLQDRICRFPQVQQGPCVEDLDLCFEVQTGLHLWQVDESLEGAFGWRGEIKL